MIEKYRLNYYPQGAVVEPIQFLLSYGGIDYEDRCYTLAKWWEIARELHHGILPILTTTNKHFNKHVAIARFMAKQVNLMGCDEKEDLEIDCAVESIEEFTQLMLQYHKHRSPSKMSQIKMFLEKFERIVAENKGYFACSKLTWADLYFVSLILRFRFLAGRDVLSGHPRLSALEAKVLALPAVQSALGKRLKYKL